VFAFISACEAQGLRKFFGEDGDTERTHQASSVTSIGLVLGSGLFVHLYTSHFLFQFLDTVTSTAK